MEATKSLQQQQQQQQQAESEQSRQHIAQKMVKEGTEQSSIAGDGKSHEEELIEMKTVANSNSSTNSISSSSSSSTLKQRWTNSCVPESVIEANIRMPSSTIATAAVALSNNAHNRCNMAGSNKSSNSKYGSAVATSAIFTSNSKNSNLNSTSASSSSPVSLSTSRTTTTASSSSATSTISNNCSLRMGSRRIFTPQFKLQVLQSYRNDSDCKGNQRATARKYNIHRRQIQKWLQCETNLRSSVANINHTTVKQQFHNVSRHLHHHHHHQHGPHHHHHHSVVVAAAQQPSLVQNANSLAVAAAYQRHLEHRQQQQEQEHHSHLFAQEQAFLSKIVQQQEQQQQNNDLAASRLSAAKIVAQRCPSLDLATVMVATSSHRRGPGSASAAVAAAAAFVPENSVVSLTHSLYNHHHHHPHTHLQHQHPHHGYPLIMPPPPPPPASLSTSSTSSSSSTSLAPVLEATHQQQHAHHQQHSIIRPYPYNGYSEHLPAAAAAAAAAAVAAAAQEANRAYDPHHHHQTSHSTSSLPLLLHHHHHHQEHQQHHQDQQHRMDSPQQPRVVLPMDLSVGHRRAVEPIDDEMPAMVKPIKLFKPYLLDNIDDNDNKVNNNNNNNNDMDLDLENDNDDDKDEDNENNNNNNNNDNIYKDNVAQSQLVNSGLHGENSSSSNCSSTNLNNSSSIQEAGRRMEKENNRAMWIIPQPYCVSPHNSSDGRPDSNLSSSFQSSTSVTASASTAGWQPPNIFHLGIGSALAATGTATTATSATATIGTIRSTELLVSSPQSAFSPTTSVPAVSPARSFRCVKGSPVSGYESSSSNYSETTAATYKYADINVELQMMTTSLYSRDDNQATSPQPSSVQKWLDHATYATTTSATTAATANMYNKTTIAT